MSIDLAGRIYDHSFRIDPVVRTLLDTDFYKLLMLQMIWKLKPTTRVAFGLQNRSTNVKLAEQIDKHELKAQLDHARTLRFQRNELVWLAGNTFYGKRQVFEPGFIEFLANFQLPEYELSERDGQLELRFDGLWTQTTMWEGAGTRDHQRAARACRDARDEPLRARHLLRPREGQALGQDRAPAYPGERRAAGASAISARGGGTASCGSAGVSRRCRRGSGRASPARPTSSTRSTLGARRSAPTRTSCRWSSPAQAESDEALAAAPFEVLKAWSKLYAGNLLVLLPDTFGTSNFLAAAPDWTADWTGARPDSKPPIEAAEELIQWWRARGRDPTKKLVVLSDAMTIDTIEQSVRALRGKVQVSIGWGTALTNDFVGCMPKA